MNVILATRNKSKAIQIKAIFEDSPISIQTFNDAGVDGEAVEDGATLGDNALKKARFVYERGISKSWAMADDTGIFIDALNGAPGVRSARWAGESASTEEIMQYCLGRMDGVSNRAATFETVVAVVSPDGKEYFFNGKVSGCLLAAPRVASQPKMPYSAIFVPEGTDLTWAEMSAEQENEISHRGKAFRQARVFLEEIYKLQKLS